MTFGRPSILLPLLLVSCLASTTLAFTSLGPSRRSTSSSFSFSTRPPLFSLSSPSAADLLPQADILSAIPTETVRARLDHLHTLFPGDNNATFMAHRVPELLTMDTDSLTKRSTDIQMQLQALLPTCRPKRMIVKVPRLLTIDFDTQIKAVADGLTREFPKDFNLFRVVYQNPILLSKDWDTAVLPKIQSLRALFPKQDLGKMITKRPDLLSRDIERTKEKMEGLAALLPAVNVADLVGRQPELIARNLTVLEERLKHLSTLFPSTNDEELAMMLTRKPSLLLANADKVLSPKIETLSKLLGAAAAQELCQDLPTILNRQIDKIEEQLSLLTVSLPGVNVVNFLKRNPAFLKESNIDVGEKIAALQAVLPAGMDVPKLLLAEPQLFSEPPETLYNKLGEVQRNTKLTSAEIAARVERDARFLLVPFGVLASRLRFLAAELAEVEEAMGLSRKSLSSLACIPVDRFVALYPNYLNFLNEHLPAAPVVGGGVGGETRKAAWTSPKNKRGGGKGGRRNSNKKDDETGIESLEKQYAFVLWKEALSKTADRRRSGAGARTAGGGGGAAAQPAAATAAPSPVAAASGDGPASAGPFHHHHRQQGGSRRPITVNIG